LKTPTFYVEGSYDVLPIPTKSDNGI